MLERFAATGASSAMSASASTSVTSANLPSAEAAAALRLLTTAMPAPLWSC
jgi:hypothetical protein